jgi:hypothetical protein
LWFCALHAIHHFSMLRSIAVNELVSWNHDTAERRGLTSL